MEPLTNNEPPPITLTITGNKVHADPNPLPDPDSNTPVQPGNTVRFVMKDQEGREIEVVFTQVRPLTNGGGPVPSLSPTEPKGPFVQRLPSSSASMSGTVAEGQQGLFIYKVFAIVKGELVELEWDNPLQPTEEFGGNSGGIRVSPGTPPGGSGGG